MEQQTKRDTLETQKAALEQLLQSKGWELLVDSLKGIIRADKRAALQSAGTLDEIINRNRITARVEVLLTLVDLPANMLDDIKEELLDFYEESSNE